MQKFSELFAKTDKASAIQHCESTLALSLSDILELIKCCESIGLKHESKYFEPQAAQPLTITAKDYEELNDMSKHPERFIGKACNALNATNTKHVTAHFFDQGKDGPWHCFYWNGPDVIGAEGGKIWGAIPHIHYTSSLFGATRQVCWDRITEKGASGVARAHVKLIKP